MSGTVFIVRGGEGSVLSGTVFIVSGVSVVSDTLFIASGEVGVVSGIV